MYIMKIYKYIGVALMVLSLGACKTDDLERDIDALKDRVTAMEAKVDRLNESMNMIRVALDGNKTIQSYTENEDGSYTLTLSDGNTITLTQGKTGATDVYQEVSISTDGNWVIGGVETEHRAVAKDGEQGVTPQFRLTMESEGKYYWEVSYDNKQTWEEIKNQQGARVYASSTESSSVAGPIASAAPNGDKFEITLTGSDTKYEIPIVSGLACAITDPTDMEVGFWIVPTGNGATTNVNLQGDAVLVNAPEGWTVTAAIGNSTLTVTPPNQDDVEATITLQVHKGLHWAVDQIKVRSKKVITSWYQEFLAGGEIVVNDVTIKKGSAENKVLINGEEVDLNVSLISSNNAEITTDGLYFIEAGLNVTYKNTQNKNKILINDSPTGDKPVVTCSNTMKLNGTNLVCKNIALISPVSEKFLTIETANAPFVAFDGCNLRIPSNATQNSFLNTTGIVMDSFSFCNSKMIVDRTGTYRILNIGSGSDIFFPNVKIENSIFSSAGNTAFKLLYVPDASSNVGIKSLVMRYTTFINLHYMAAGFINGDISQIDMKNNLIYSDNNGNKNVTVFRKRGNYPDSFDGKGSGFIIDNKGYVFDGSTLISWFGGISPILKENSNEFEQLSESPFESESLNKSTGTYVLKPEYQGYGATIKE